jgi:photosystem II stability/assembly factor-like uncharacterized protein
MQWNRSLVTIIRRLMALSFAPTILPLYGQASFTFMTPVTVVQADPHQSGTLLAGTARALLFRSRDKADTWTSLPFPAESRASLHALLIDPARPKVYLAAVSSETPQFAGVYRTSDEGATWEQLRDLRQKQVWSLALSAADARILAAGTQDGVYLSRDSGQTWTRISSPWPAGPWPVVALTFGAASSNILYAGTPHLPWKTTNGGVAWRRIPKGMEEDSDVFSIEVDWNRPRRLFAGACSGIYRSLDGGVTWASLEQALGAPYRTYVVARAPGSTRVVFAGTSSGLLQSSDGGVTWRKLSAWTTRSIAFDPNDPHRIFVATDHGILRSNDGGSHFREANEGLYDRSFAGRIDRHGSALPASPAISTIR